MKQILLLMAAAGAMLAAHAQVKEGQITYEQKINMHRKLLQQDERMKQRFPEFITEKVVLFFKPNESLSKRKVKGDDIQQTGGAHQDAVMVPMGGGSINDEVYKNFTTGKMVSVKELGPRKYLVEETLDKINWKILEEDTKEILGYLCKKAVTTNKKGQPVEAWFTEQVVTQAGPDIYGALPGAILELNINSGEQVYKAIQVSKSTDDALVKMPAKGKKISLEDWNKLVESEFGAPPPGGPGAVPVRRPFGGG